MVYGRFDTRNLLQKLFPSLPQSILREYVVETCVSKGVVVQRGIASTSVNIDTSQRVVDSRDRYACRAILQIKIVVTTLQFLN